MSERIVIDPITRIEGHLRVEAAIENGKIKDAYSSGTMVRGIENIVRDRDPRDAWVFVGRVCGVCTSIHSLCSVRAVENALGISVPPNAEMVRNIMEAVLYMHDHTVHFYQLHALDWVDIVSGLKADPKAAALLAQQLSPWPKNTEGYFTEMQNKLKKFVASGQLGIFANGYWGHPAYKLTPEQNLIATIHYLEALEWQKEIVKVHAVFGGKNPHPNFLVGGMPCSIDLNEANAINAERLALVKQKLQEGKDFIDQVYIPDLLMIAGVYKDEWSKIGGGVSNYLSYGDFPLHGYAGVEDYMSPRGIVLNRDLSKVHPVDANSPEEIKESGFGPYYIDHTLGIWPQAAGGVPQNACEFQVKADPVTDIMEDMAAEQKARVVYDNLLRLATDEEVKKPLRFLRQREIVHFQRFGEALRLIQDDLNKKNFYAYNPEFDKNCCK